MKEWFPEALGIANVWLKTESPANKKWLMHISKERMYGFSSIGEWVCKEKQYNIEDFDRLATKREVGKALEKEAIKRGYREGVLIEDIYIGTKERPNITVSSDDFDWEKIPVGKRAGVMALRDSEGSILFTEGHWTPII